MAHNYIHPSSWKSHILAVNTFSAQIIYVLDVTFERLMYWWQVREH
jgi:hypothetical protein